MFYKDTQICFQEVPGEISLAFTMIGCKLHCKGCHSAELWNYTKGKELTLDDFKYIVNKYKNLVTCILFFGGEWNEDFNDYLIYAQYLGYKTCLYTGLDDIPDSVKKDLDYLKVGRWIEELGGLSSKTTNQRFYDLKNNEDITYKFQKENK